MLYQGEVLFFKRFKRDDWIVVNPCWFSAFLDELRQSQKLNEEKNYWLYFLGEETNICDDCQNVFNNVKDSLVIYFLIEYEMWINLPMYLAEGLLIFSR